METSDDQIFIMRERIDTLIDEEKWEKAIDVAASTLETYTKKYEEDPDENLGDYTHALEIRANLHRDQGELEVAEEQYVKIVDLMRESQSYPEVCGRVGANLAMIYENRELTIEAMKFYVWSLENLVLVDPPKPLDIAGVNNNLAYLYEIEGYFDEAEVLFNRALTTYKDELGDNGTRVGDVYNNLGGLFYRQNKNEQALEMHEKALGIREQTLGPAHLDTAQSYGNIALVHAALEKTNLAKGAYNSALKILEQVKEPSVMDHYAIISTNYSHLLKSLELNKEVSKLEKRANKFMKSLI